MDWQWIIVGAVVLMAVVYSGRTFFRQFFHGEDEPAACSNCPALKAVEDGRKPKRG